MVCLCIHWYRRTILYRDELGTLVCFSSNFFKIWSMEEGSALGIFLPLLLLLLSPSIDRRLSKSIADSLNRSSTIDLGGTARALPLAATPNQPVQGSFLKLLPTQMEVPEGIESSSHSSSSSLDQSQSRYR
ncbi:hypothetical protein BHE74_00058266 [Ensete ventricosum]|nr:hypothetical protein BHE74_00058266 [Ensete ventricosum]